MVAARVVNCFIALSIGAVLLATGACGSSVPLTTTSPAILADAPTVPLVDHHQHLVSPAAASGVYPALLPEVTVPMEISELLELRRTAGRDVKALAELFTEDAIALNVINEDLPTWVRGRQAVAEHISTLFSKPYRIEPVALSGDATHATITGYYLRPDTGRRAAHVLLSLTKGRDDRWRIAAETPARPGPFARDPLDADKLIAELDEAGIGRAVVLSVAYWFGSDFRSIRPTDEYGAVRAENDWVAAQVTRYPDRLVAFCSFNPLRPYAMMELERCAASGHFAGIKMHFGNSDVDLRKPDHASAVYRLFAAANKRNLAIVAHLWTSPEFDETSDVHAQRFLDAVAHSPNVTVQIAHLAGGGRSSLKAMEVFAQAFEAQDARTRLLYFDVATLADNESPSNLAANAQLMRRIGLDRFVYGSDLSPPPPLTGWAGFHRMPLTQSEFRQIATNVAPYLPR